MLEWIVSSTALIAAVVLLRFALKGRIGPRLQYALWAVVLARLLIPVSFGGAAMSVENLTHKAAATEEARLISALSELELPRMSHQAAYDQVAREYADRGLAIGERPPAQYAEAVEHEIMEKRSGGLSVAGLLRLLWLGGAALTGACFLLSNLRLGRRLKKTRALLSGEHALPVYLSGAIETPCLFGLFRPAVYLTGEAAGDGRTARHAVEHELTHFRHGDHLWGILRCVCLAIHWYNPLVWCAAVLSRNDAELACDESTLLRLGEEERAAYGRTLLRLTCEKRPALLSAATTMTGSGRSIRERIALIAKKPKMAGVTLAAALLITGLAVGCTFTGAPETGSPPPDETASPSPMGRYASVERYVMEQVEGKAATQLLRLDEEGEFQEVEAVILDRKLAFLERYGSLEGLAPDGTLEAWGYDWLEKYDLGGAEPESVLLAGGAYLDEEGYFCWSTGQIVIALRYPDGSYDILGEETYGDGFDFFGYHDNDEESLYDWYVKKNGLDLPLYVEDWTDQVTVPEGGSLGNFPVHRYDGDGWYLYIPVIIWEGAETSADHGEWRSGYATGSMLVVDRFTQSLEDEYTISREQGFAPLDDTGRVWRRTRGGVNEDYYFYPAGDGEGCYRVWTLWTDEGITDYPYIAMEPEVLRLMAESFTVDERFSQAGTAGGR